MTRIRRWKFLGPPSGPGGPLDGETWTDYDEDVYTTFEWPVFDGKGRAVWTDRAHVYKFERVRRRTARFRYVGLSLVEEQPK